MSIYENVDNGEVRDTFIQEFENMLIYNWIALEMAGIIPLCH